MTARKKNRRNAAPIAVACVCLLMLACLAAFWARRWEPQKKQLIYPLEYREELLAASEEFDIDPCLLAALVYCESSFQADAVSSVGAIGLMQIMPETGQWLSGKVELDEEYTTESLYDPAVNLRLGCWYLSYLHRRYDGRWQEALTAYIAGQGQVDRWLQDPALSADGKTLDVIPGQDVKEYAAKVMRTHESYKEAYPDVLVCTLADGADGSDGRNGEQK